MMESWQPRKENFTNISEYLSQYLMNRKASSNNIQDQPIPPDMQVWLSRLSLLSGIPFNYLVPDENMLPVESIRFFYLDSNWIESLLDGACSIGRNTSGDISHDSVFIDSIRTAAYSETTNLRRQLLGKQRCDGLKEAAPVHTGFLLRSILVSAFPGLEVQGFSTLDDTQQPLEILRMEKLSDNVMICLFAGEVQRLEIHEPPEGLHFGGDLDTDGNYKRPLRQLNGQRAPIGSWLQKDGQLVTVDIPLRERDLGVIDVTSLVNKMVIELKAQQAFDTYFTSAEFAVEMIETAQMGVFDNKN